MRTYAVHSTTTEVYVVEAESMDDAIEQASEMTEPTYTRSQGFEYVVDLKTGEDRCF
jgi:hypothetical protein